MKTLREYIDQLDEISRRDFLKGAGAAAIGAAVGKPQDAQADWEKEPDIVDRMTDEKTTKFKNISNDGQATLQYFYTPNQGRTSRSMLLWRNGGRWIQPRGQGYGTGRLRVDNLPPFDISFSWMNDPRGNVVSNPVSIMGPVRDLIGDEYQQMISSVLQAKQRILIDASMIGGDILEFRPNIREEEDLEEASPDAVKRIEELIKYK